MTLPFEDVDVFIESTDNVLHSVENRGSTQWSVIGNSIKIPAESGCGRQLEQFLRKQQ